MAKTKLKRFIRVGPPGSTTIFAPRGVKFKKVNSWVEVARAPDGFIACAKIGYGNVRKGRSTNLGSCAVARNPRKAISAALRKAANVMAGRSGAFAGLR